MLRLLAGIFTVFIFTGSVHSASFLFGSSLSPLFQQWVIADTQVKVFSAENPEL